jgi:uncharacterized protein (TIGR02231 family)
MILVQGGAMRYLAIPLVLLPTALAAASVTVGTRPNAVTVFPGGALVEHRGEVQLAAGLHQLTVPGLPARLDDASVRIRVGGGAKPHLVGFAVQGVPVESVVSPEARALEGEQEKLKDEDAALESAQGVLGDRVAFVQSLRSTFQARAALNMALGPIDVAAWAAVYGLAGARLAALSFKEQELGQKRREVARKADLVRRQLEQIASKREKEVKTIALDLRAREDGMAVIELRYLVPNAGWQSAYDAHLEGSSIRFVHYGVVHQESGEDWTDVKLTLSSASASQWVAIPELTAQNLTFARPRPVYKPKPRRYYRRRAEKAVREEASAPAGAPATAADQVPADETRVVSTARVSEFAASYQVEGRATVPSTGAPRRIVIAIHPLEARLEYHAVPRLRGGAFLLARGVYKREVPLLPGEVSLFLGKDYVGETRLPFVSTGADLRLAFGRDDRMRVRRTQLLRKVNTQGIFTKEYRIDYRYKFDVANLVGRGARLVLLDQVPASMDERIKVEIHEETSPQAPLTSEDAKGTIRFELDLAPDAKQELKLGYSVTYPQSLNVYGLE